jgi:hypothetical protein
MGEPVRESGRREGRKRERREGWETSALDFKKWEEEWPGRYRLEQLKGKGKERDYKDEEELKGLRVERQTKKST